mmetsp:Transcript_12969/g.28250  ORF Transcript_12969/g.28250 Transcript_12969/m.28250 type:complete len:175 (-) Transcript_12969:1065-1589(-)
MASENAPRPYPVVLPTVTFANSAGISFLDALTLVLEGLGMTTCLLNNNFSSAYIAVVDHNTRQRSEIFRARYCILQHTQLEHIVHLAVHNTKCFVSCGGATTELESMQAFQTESIAFAVLHTVLQKITDFKQHWDVIDFEHQNALDMFLGRMLTESVRLSAVLQARLRTAPAPA